MYSRIIMSLRFLTCTIELGTAIVKPKIYGLLITLKLHPSKDYQLRSVEKLKTNYCGA
jgi:hypothetical protein